MWQDAHKVWHLCSNLWLCPYYSIDKQGSPQIMNFECGLWEGVRQGANMGRRTPCGASKGMRMSHRVQFTLNVSSTKMGILFSKCFWLLMTVYFQWRDTIIQPYEWVIKFNSFSRGNGHQGPCNPYKHYPRWLTTSHEIPHNNFSTKSYWLVFIKKFEEFFLSSSREETYF